MGRPTVEGTMIDPPFRSPRAKVGGIFHFGRMIDKIRRPGTAAPPETTNSRRRS
ncbi:MAG: DUF5069 domain-containing protein [Chthoniobacterales bacterium]|nr:DUF5069 domain-containing protein [Chthoniobacterales bacterium]